MGLYGEVIVGSNCLGRTLDGDEFINPGMFFGGSSPVRSPFPPMGSGSIHIYKGDIKMFGLGFKGDLTDPLRFVISEGGDYVHIGGMGSVEKADGRVIFTNKK